MKKKNKIKILAISTLLTGVLGVSAIAPKYINQAKAESENVVNINRENKKLVSYDDENHEITLLVNELNNYTWENLYDYYFSIVNGDNDLPSFNYNSSNYDYAGISDEQSAYYFSDEDNDIFFMFDHEIYNDVNSTNYTKDYVWLLNGEISSFEYEMHLPFNTADYQQAKTAIELDIQANTPESMGEQIIDTITSGLGLIGDLAQEFLTGFSKILWDAEHTKLTDFALFSLIMLGVAVSFAVIKLVLNIVRSNTGA